MKGYLILNNLASIQDVMSANRNSSLALSDEILMSIEKPARYIGGEVNAVIKDKEKVDVRFAMCFPDVYEIGMSHLGIQILYDMFNRYDDVWCERVYSPWVDLDRLMREQNIPLFALESQDPVKAFDFLGITLQYEMCYTNVLQVLDLSGIPLLAKDRTQEDPIVIGGGPCSYNPEPIADFFDLFYIGEGETQYRRLLAKDRTQEDPIVIGGGPCSYNPEPIADFFDLFYIGEGETQYRRLLDVYKETKAAGGSRSDFLLRVAREIPGMYVPSLYEVSYKEDGTIAAFQPVYKETKAAGGSRSDFLLRVAREIPGMYVPSLYEVSYKEDGTIAAFQPICEGVPEHITKEIVMDLDNVPYPVKPVVPYIKATQDRVVLEIQRGCIRGCRFCQAGQLYRPVREKSLETLKNYARQMLESTGQEEISLSSLSSSDYSHLEELVDFLMDTCEQKKVNISLPSLRIDAFSLDVMGKVQDVKKSSLTFAPEAGSQRLRDIINKGLTEEDILKGAGLAFEGGWSRVKLYFMLGLPFETEEDICGIAELANKIAALYYDVVPKDKRSGPVQIVASTSFFIPKPFTPFQWARSKG